MLKYLILLVLVENLASQECGNSTDCRTFSAKMSIRLAKTQAICPTSMDYNKIAPPFMEISDPTGPPMLWSVQCGGNYTYLNIFRTFGKESINTQPLDAGCHPKEDVFIWVYCPSTQPNCSIELDYEEPMLLVKRPWGLGRVNMSANSTKLMFCNHMGSRVDVGFNKTWGDYVNGFCTFNSSCWVGLENLRRLMQYRMKFYFEVQFTQYSIANRVNYAQAYYYNLGLDGPKYQLAMRSPYYMYGDENAGGMADSLYAAVGKPFSTFDNDNDRNATHNCAKLHGAGWWFGNCSDVQAFTAGSFNKKWDLPRSLIFINFKAPIGAP